MPRPRIPAYRDTASFSKLATDFLVRGGRSPRTAESYALAFSQFEAFLRRGNFEDHVKNFTASTVESFRQHLSANGVKGSSIAVKLAALSSLGRYGSRTKDPGRGRFILRENPVLGVPRPKRVKPPARYLYPDEIRALLNVEAPAHERLALALLFDTNVGASAVAGASVGDVNRDGDRVRLSAIARSKKLVTVDLSTALAERLLESIEARQADPDEPLLINSGGNRYTRTALSEMVARLARKAGITRFPVRAHLFARHSPASLAGQADLSGLENVGTLQQRDTETTKSIQGVNADAVRAKVRRLIEEAPRRPLRRLRELRV